MSWVESGGPMNLIIQLDKKVEGEPLRAAMAAMSLSNFIKQVIVVDQDIDIGNLKQVMWAISTRVQADRDVNILKNIQGQVLDPSIAEEISLSLIHIWQLPEPGGGHHGGLPGKLDFGGRLFG